MLRIKIQAGYERENLFPIRQHPKFAVYVVLAQRLPDEPYIRRIVFGQNNPDSEKSP